MAKPKRKIRHKKPGLPPGSIVYTGSKHDKSLIIEIFDFNAENLVERNANTLEDVLSFENIHNTTWINIDGLSDVQKIKALGKHYRLHPLLVEDIVNVSQRAKIEEYDKYVFVVSKMLRYENDSLIIEHVSFVLGNGFLLSFQETEGDVFEPIRDRIRNSKGIVRKMGTDYLLFALLDVIVDNYAVIVDEIVYKAELLEDSLISGTESENIVTEIQELKKEILRIRKAIYPMREVTGGLFKLDEHISDKTKLYISDLEDHVVQVLENIELNREIIWGLMDLHMTTINNKMNTVMKVLTIIATIFIPLTFIAGIYGMNFEFMPELQFKYSYPILMGVMFLIFVVMVFFFKKKKWL